MSEPITTGQPRIMVTEHGPYRVVGDVAIYDAEGNLLRGTGSWCLCRCGGSRAKPFCDVTHGLKGFDGSESADHGSIADRRASYAADGVTVYDDRSRCAHFGQCSSRLPGVFRADAEPFVDPDGAPPADITAVVAGCPSGALAYAVGDDPEPVERREPASITPIVDGPYRVRGAIEVVGADGHRYERRERQTLCRCGHSRNRPFCDGSHWYAGFRDPLPPELVRRVPSLYEWAGGLDAFERLTSRFYDAILSEPDPVLEPVFRGMDPGHPKLVAAWLAETFGGPATYTHKHGGYEHMVAKHRNLGLTEAQRKRWVARMAETADEVGLPADPGFRSTFLAYLEWGTRIAVINSQPDAAVIEHAPIPLWGWGQTPPFDPQPWDDPDAAKRGRQRPAAVASPGGGQRRARRLGSGDDSVRDRAVGGRDRGDPMARRQLNAAHPARRRSRDTPGPSWPGSARRGWNCRELDVTDVTGRENVGGVEFTAHQAGPAVALKWRSIGAMPAVQIKDVPADVHEVLRRRARAAGQSLQEYLRSTLIAQARQPTLQEIFDEVEHDPAPSSAPLAATTALVREARDRP